MAFIFNQDEARALPFVMRLPHDERAIVEALVASQKDEIGRMGALLDQVSQADRLPPIARMIFENLTRTVRIMAPTGTAERTRTLTQADQDRYIGAYSIVSGVEMPHLRIWRDGERLFSEISGMRVGARETFIDEDGVMFNRLQPSGAEVTFGPDGRARELLSVRPDGTPLIRAVRMETGPDA